MAWSSWLHGRTDGKCRTKEKQIDNYCSQGMILRIKLSNQIHFKAIFSSKKRWYKLGTFKLLHAIIFHNFITK